MVEVGCVSDVVLPESFGKVEAKVCHCKDKDYCNGCQALKVTITLLTACAFVVFTVLFH